MKIKVSFSCIGLDIQERIVEIPDEFKVHDDFIDDVARSEATRATEFTYHWEEIADTEQSED